MLRGNGKEFFNYDVIIIIITYYLPTITKKTMMNFS